MQTIQHSNKTRQGNCNAIQYQKILKQKNKTRQSNNKMRENKTDQNNTRHVNNKNNEEIR